MNFIDKIFEEFEENYLSLIVVLPFIVEILVQ